MGKKSLPTSAMLESEDDFVQAYETYQQRIHRFLFWRTQDEAVSEDLTSNVFEKAWRSRANFHGGSVQAWLYRIARNVLIDHWRKVQPVPLEDAAEMVVDEAPSMAERLDTEQEVARLRGALAQLPDDTRRLVELRFIEGLSARDVAERLGTTEGNVRVLQYRALKRIRKLLS